MNAAQGRAASPKPPQVNRGAALSAKAPYLVFMMCLVATSVHATGTFVRDWEICGPFTSHSVQTPVVAHEAKVSPDADVEGKAWKTVHSGADVVDLEAADACGPTDNAVAFAFTEIEVDEEGDLELGIGSDDAVAVWWNGRPVLVHDVLRGTTPGEDRVYVHAKKGKNAILLKVYDEGGGWSFVVDAQSASGR